MYAKKAQSARRDLDYRVPLVHNTQIKMRQPAMTSRSETYSSRPRRRYRRRDGDFNRWVEGLRYRGYPGY